MNIADEIYEVAQQNIIEDTLGEVVRQRALIEDLYSSSLEYALDIAGYNHLYEFVLDHMADVPIQELEL